jgi:hypothetical protein
MGKGWAWDWLVVRLSLVVMHLMCGYGGGLGGGGVIGSFGTWYFGYGSRNWFGQ